MRDQRELHEAFMERGYIQFDAKEVFLHLTDDDKREVAKGIAFDETLMECLVKWLTEGEVEWDGDESGPWYCGSANLGPTIERVQKLLLPLVPEITQQLVRQLMCERDYSRQRCQSYHGHAATLQSQWANSQRPKENAFLQTPQWTKEDAKRFIDRWSETDAFNPTEFLRKIESLQHQRDQCRVACQYALQLITDHPDARSKSDTTDYLTSAITRSSPSCTE